MTISAGAQHTRRIRPRLDWKSPDFKVPRRAGQLREAKSIELKYEGISNEEEGKNWYTETIERLKALEIKYQDDDVGDDGLENPNLMDQEPTHHRLDLTTGVTSVAATPISSFGPPSHSTVQPFSVQPSPHSYTDFYNRPAPLYPSPQPTPYTSLPPPSARGSQVVAPYSAPYPARQYPQTNIKKRPLEEEMVEEDDEEDDGKEGPGDHTKKRRSKLPLRAILIFRKWFTDHVKHPYPTPNEKRELAREASLSTKQTNNWFTNTRKRFWVPYMAKLKQQQLMRGLPVTSMSPPSEEELFSES